MKHYTRLFLGQPRANSSQRGFVLVLLILGALIGLGVLFAGALSVTSQRVERDRITQEALAKAKEALLSFASGNRTKGHLPCPEDRALVGFPLEGNALSACGSDALRIGRLPWRTLGLGDLRDGYGERLWYVVSANFRPTSTPINSDTTATLSVNGVANFIVIVFSAGEPNPNQTRNSTVAFCATTSSSIGRDYCATNYLDTLPSGLSNSNANVTFAENAWIQGVFNDKSITITPAEFLARVQPRVLRQVAACLIAYSNDPANLNHLFPWAVPVGSGSNPNPFPNPDPGQNAYYVDRAGIRLGRLPDNLSDPAAASRLTTGVTSWNGPDCPLYCNTSPCPDAASTRNWLKDWREHVFYAVSQRYSPAGNGATGPLLTVGTNTAVRAVVFIAGPLLAVQARGTTTQRNTASNYVEGENLNGDDVYSNASASSTFNDSVMIVK